MGWWVGGFRLAFVVVVVVLLRNPGPLVETPRKRVVDHLETVPEMRALNHHTNP